MSAGSWTHLVCHNCWNFMHPDKKVKLQPPSRSATELCCMCGSVTSSGLYFRANPDAMDCARRK